MIEVNKKNNIWKMVAAKWRFKEEESEFLVSIEEITEEITNEILDGGLLKSTFDFLDSDDEDDDDEDWP
ncbi:hypothetical protein [Bacillus sp. UNCCL81]|uniref:hypothetical protein n=1 Tax=Bacillus sp. UNCCL81 TaxID=1502755 RepID=UPI0008F30925|nr:hypothetical protein [Bacillus sp. UNCCL81]SFC95175.1 hypothetical protein SAMN02799633_02115 [Bacillus sp. UNCCL81]